MFGPLLNILTRLSSLSLYQWVSFALFCLVTAILIEQLQYHLKRRSLPGPNFTIPFLGGIIHMVRAPFDFWHGQMKYGKISWNSIVGQYFIMTADHDCSRKIFENCSEEMPLALHPNALRLLGKDNIAFMNGPSHRALRAGLLPLFTQKALSMYLSIQENTIRQSLQKWAALSADAKGEGIEMRTLIYDLNTNTSMSVFMGPYMTPEGRLNFQRDYSLLTQGMFAFPIYFPGTQVWHASKARVRILDSLSAVAAAAKQRMRKGGEPACLLDFWMVNVNKDIDAAAASNGPTPDHSTDLEIAKVTLDFLFASQDASTSSLTFTIHELCKHPEVLQRVREEQQRVRKDKNAPITVDVLAELKYTWQVMKEVLRLRPPATIVPHITKREFQVNDDYVAPPHTLIVPSIWSSNRVGFPNPESFDPDRFNDDRKEHIVYEKQFLTFGTGPHSCMGYRYAMNHIMLFMSLLTDCQFERMSTNNMNEIIYLPTIYPADGCRLKTLKV